MQELGLLFSVLVASVPGRMWIYDLTDVVILVFGQVSGIVAASVGFALKQPQLGVAL